MYNIHVLHCFLTTFLVIGVLRDHNYGGIEALHGLIQAWYMDTTFNVGLEFSNKSMKKKGNFIFHSIFLQFHSNLITFSCIKTIIRTF